MQDIPAIAGRGARTRRAGADGQHLGDPALLPAARPRRRPLDPGRHQIYRRPLRPDARHGLGQRGRLGRSSRTPSSPPASASGRTTCTWRCAGLRTLGVRLARHHESGLDGRALARTAAGGAARPAPGAARAHPGHAIWKRDFTGACGLFAIVLKPVPEKAVLAFLDALTLFGIGASWGGFESLAIPFDVTAYPDRDELGAGRPGVRFHIGLEDVGDLIADLERGFAALAAAQVDAKPMPKPSDIVMLDARRAVARDPLEAGVLRRGDERISRSHRRAQSQGQRHRLAAGPRRSDARRPGRATTNLRAARTAAGCTASRRRSRT